MPTPSLERRPGPVQELSVLVPARTGEERDPARVQVRVVERAGEVKVAVHTPDAQLSQALRDRLGELVQRLEQTGYRTETWNPAEARLEGISRQELHAERESTGKHLSQDDSRGSAQHHARQQRQRPQDQPHWVESLAAAGLRGETAPAQSQRRN